MKILASLFFLACAVCFDVGAANINIERVANPVTESCSDNFQGYVVGKIEKGDAEIFSRAINKTLLLAKTDCADGLFSIGVHSQGGDVIEAIKLGRLIRKNSFQVMVSLPSECTSACVFILAGGVRRIALGKVGIHRPYYESLDSKLSMPQVRKQRDEFNAIVLDYLREMDMPSSLFDAMNATSSESIKYLTFEEKDQFRLNGEDTTFDEYRNAQIAKMYGITSGELRRRSALGSATCFLGDGRERLDGCYSAILLGVDVSTFKLRRERSWSVCKKSDTECSIRVLRGQ
jgi:hypothetical protein